ncbi:MAG TPA: hypothetical protein VJP87_03575 [Candidatus Acidoferrales bacterium]|nr:hypothetical protein [Candidatus Acidoferrales bacterium]
MKCLVPVPREWADYLKRQKETGMGYQVVSVNLKDGRSFDQVVASEGCIIQVRGHRAVPFAAEDVASIEVNHRVWNFREAAREVQAHRALHRAAGAN